MSDQRHGMLALISVIVAMVSVFIWCTFTWATPSVIFSPPDVIELQAASPTSLIVGDYDQSGALDIFILHTNGFDPDEIAVYLGETEDPNEIPFEQAVSSNAGSTVDRVAISDIDGDDIPDLVAGARGGYSSGSVWGSICGTDGNANQRFPVMSGVGDGTFQLETCLALNDYSGYTDTYFVGVAVADFDNDMNMDVVAARTGNYGEKVVKVFFGSGGFNYSAPLTVYDSGVSGNRPRDIAAGDFVGDANLDLLVETLGPIYSFEGDGLGGFGPQTSFGGEWPSAGPIFVNDDAFPDLVTIDVAGISISYGLEGGGYDPSAQIVPLQGGEQPGYPVVRDLDEDGDADMFVTFRNFGENGTMAVYYQDSGGPICTDDDGDGYAIEGGACGEVDCDDTDLAVNPGAPEVPGNGIDDNCNGQIDETGSCFVDTVM